MRLRVASSLSNSWAKEPIEAVDSGRRCRKTLREPVSVNSRTSLRSAEMEIGKWQAETGARNPRPKDENARNCRSETGARQPNPREDKRFSPTRKNQPGDRTAWLSKQDSNQSMHFICIAFSRRKTRAKLRRLVRQATRRTVGRGCFHARLRRRCGARGFAAGAISEIPSAMAAIMALQKPATHESPKNPWPIFSDTRPHGLTHFRHRNRLVVRRFIFRIVANYLYVMPFTGFCEAAYAIL